MGEEQLFIEMGVKISNRLVAYDENLFSKDYLKSIISPDDTILLHGGGNFGDLYRYHTKMRNFVISTFPNNRIVILPQSINYRNKTLAMLDNLVYSNATDLTIMARNFDSFNTSINLFPDVKTVFIPDAAFMIGDVKPLKPPVVDILVIRRIDNERRFDLDSWEGLIRKNVGNKYTFLVRDWTDYEDVKYKTLKQLASRRLDLTNKIISQGRVIISDRLHASVMSVLMGKPHVIINEKYKKVYYTRESAFYGISQCSPDDLRGYYANSIEDAILIAIKLLNEIKQ